MKKYLIIAVFVLACCLSLIMPEQANAQTFADVPQSHWAYNQIERAYADGVISGTEYNATTGVRKFAPEAKLTNAEFLSIITRAFYKEEIASSSASGKWYDSAIEVAKKHSLHNHIDILLRENINAPMGRYQMARVIANLLKDYKIAQASDEELKATQAKIGDWNIDYIYTNKETQNDISNVFYTGLMTGKDAAGSFKPYDNITRAEAAAIYCRLKDYISSGNYNTIASYSKTEPSVKAVNLENTEQKTTDFEKSQNYNTISNELIDNNISKSDLTNLYQEETNIIENKDNYETTEAITTLANGKEITDENILEILDQVKADYPDGMTWTNDNEYFSEALYCGGLGCEGFALICSDAIFGELPVNNTHSNFDEIRIGDMIRMNNDTHTVVVIGIDVNEIIVAEGNFNNSILWGRKISKQELVNDNFVVRSRYPDNI